MNNTEPFYVAKCGFYDTTVCLNDFDITCMYHYVFIYCVRYCMCVLAYVN